VQRQAMKDLDALLRKQNMYLPRHGFFQFDNCSENKVNIAGFLILNAIY
jgi:hypothetical protein